ncbi:signal peptide peptidase SppA, partial [Spirochaetota bacterium]
GIDESVIKSVFKKGSLTPEEAKKTGLVDKVMYPNEAIDESAGDMYIVGLGEYISDRKRVYLWGAVPGIAIIYVNGAIVRGKTPGGDYFDSMGDETYKEMLEDVFSDWSVKAVVIRIDSGGGSATASDYMWNTLAQLKKTYKKPVVLSFGNIAASGGYYISCSGDKIYSSRGTITGSIGVIFGKISLKEIYAKLGISKDVIKMSEFSDIYSESRELTPREKKLIQSGIDFTYKRFTDRVMKSRGIKEQDIPGVARGRVFTGSRAKKLKLVDEVGGLITAIEYARSLSKIEDYYKITKLPDDKLYFGSLFSSSQSRLLSEYFKSIIQNMNMLRFKNEKFLYLYPYIVTIR